VRPGTSAHRVRIGARTGLCRAVEIVEVRIHDCQVTRSREVETSLGVVLRHPVYPAPIHNDVLGAAFLLDRDQGWRCFDTDRSRDLQSDQPVMVRPRLEDHGTIGESRHHEFG